MAVVWRWHEVFREKKIHQRMAPVDLKLEFGQKHNLASIRLGQFCGSTLRLPLYVDLLCNKLECGAGFSGLSLICPAVSWNETSSSAVLHLYCMS